MFARFAAWCRGRAKRQSPPKRALCPSDHGFSIRRDGGPTTEVRWSEVVEVITWKRDLLTTDQICLGFRIKDRLRIVMINEEDEGWREIRVHLERHFPSIAASWHQEVMQPPFALNWKTIWGEPSDPAKVDVLWH
jgi:hypothetical protein